MTNEEWIALARRKAPAEADASITVATIAAIDAGEFILARHLPDMPPKERRELVADILYEGMRRLGAAMWPGGLN